MLGRSLIYRSVECARFSALRIGSGAAAMKPFAATRQPSRGLRQIAEQTYEQLVRREQVPTYALIIGSCALCFQVAVLFPWHEKLSEEFEALEVRIFRCIEYNHARCSHGCIMQTLTQCRCV